MSVRFTGDLVPAQYHERLSDALGSGEEYGFYTLGGAVTTNTGLVLNVAEMGEDTYVVNGTMGAAYTASTVTIDYHADAILPRIDIVLVDSAGAVSVRAGAAAAAPLPPNLADDELHIAQINVAAAQTAISASDITDMRQKLPLRRVMIRKSADQSVTSSAVLADDDELLFAIPPSTNWICDLHFWVTSSAVPAFKWQVTVPSGATLIVTGTVDAFAAPYTVNTLAKSIPAGESWAIRATEVDGFQYVPSQYGIAVATLLGSLRIVVKNSTTAGNVAFQWCQAVSSASAAVVKEGSSLTAQQVA